MHQFRVSVHVLTVFLLPLSVMADAVYNEVGDAGNNMATAQRVSGFGPLTQINGHLLESAPNTSTLVDVYQIFISDPMNFSATTSGAVPDPELALFDAQGHALELSRDITGGATPNRQAHLIGGAAPPGIYYLWISAQDRDPGYCPPGCGGAYSEMFPPAPAGVGSVKGPINDTFTLAGPVGNVNALNVGSNLAYTVTLTGTDSIQPVQVPTLSTWGLLILGTLLAGCSAVLISRRCGRRAQG